MPVRCQHKNVRRGQLRKLCWLTLLTFLSLRTPGAETVPEAKQADWPLAGMRLVYTEWHAWIVRFFATDSANNLFYGRLIDQKPVLRKVLQFPRQPDVLKHFPLSDGDLVVSVYNPEKYMHFVAFDFDGALRYSNEFALAYNVYDLEARVTVTGGNPTCLFYAYDKRNYAIKYWSEQKTQDILVSRDPIPLMLLEWQAGTIHIVSEMPQGLSWTRWQNGQYHSHELPVPLRHAQFYFYRGTVHLIGIDHEGGLWQFDLSTGRLRQNLLLRDRRFVRLERVAAFQFNRELNILLSSTRVADAYRLRFADFPSNAGKPEQRRFFWPGNIYPIIDRANQLNVLLETELEHIYLESWASPTAILSEIDWRLDVRRNPPVMVVAWSIPENAEYAYRYLLDQKKDSEPLAEAKLIPSRTLQFAARQEGMYVLHIQVKNLRTGSYSRVYHIPLLWQYAPPEPELLLQNTVAPRMVRAGRAVFLLKNPHPGPYYATIDQTPDTVPQKPVAVESGSLSFAVNKPGRYYLHLANRDPRSQVLSPVAHYLFFVSPFSPEQDPTLSENYRRIQEIQRIRKQIEKAKGDPGATQPWINRLEEIESSLR
ncbi:MAG: hypothetical protein N2Z22_04910 [Turneriella sp.]|nr:hypothetical protein [Turneriella sp.]